MSEKTSNNKDLFPNNIQFLCNLPTDSFASMGLDNSICVFKSINDIYYLIYSNLNNSIISFNLINNKIINEIKNAHNTDITNFRYCLDSKNKRDLILSISFGDNNLKLWDANNWMCLLNLQTVNNIGYIKTSCFLNDTKNIYIITSNSCESDLIEPIKIYDLNGNKIKEINESNEDTIFIDTYFDKKLSIYFIITGNNGYIKSYNYNENSSYLIYKDIENYYDHSSIIIDNNNNEEIVNMIESCGDGFVRIWNFHSAQIIKKIKVSNSFLYSIYLWDNNYLLVTSRDKKIKIISLSDGEIKKELGGYDKDVITVKSINHPIYGKCFISKGKFNEQIKLWIIQNKN